MWDLSPSTPQIPESPVNKRSIQTKRSSLSFLSPGVSDNRSSLPPIPCIGLMKPSKSLPASLTRISSLSVCSLPTFLPSGIYFCCNKGSSIGILQVGLFSYCYKDMIDMIRGAVLVRRTTATSLPLTRQPLIERIGCNYCMNFPSTRYWYYSILFHLFI